MTENNETQDTQGQQDLTKSQQAGGGEPKQGQADESLNPTNDQQAGQEEKTFQADPAEAKADKEAEQLAQGGGKVGEDDIESEPDTEIDDEGEDTQSETSNT